MFLKVLTGIMIPFIGTLIGSSVIFASKKGFGSSVNNILSALAGGIMLAASIWSLIIPSLEISDGNGLISILQTTSGFFVGIISMIVTDKIIQRINKSTAYENKTLMQLIAVTVHNIPEGMAVGMAFATSMTQKMYFDFSSAFLLSLGIAIQNIPEGAIVTMPLLAENRNKKKTLMWGSISGIVEPVGAFAAIIASRCVGMLLPFFLSFAAGAMIFVVTEQLIPDMYENKANNKGIFTLIFSFGFLMMMSLDVIFG